MKISVNLFFSVVVFLVTSTAGIGKWWRRRRSKPATVGPSGPWLEVLNGEDKGARFDISSDKQLIGRHSQADLLLHDSQGKFNVSRRHAHIWASQNSVWIADNNAAFGVVVNGHKIQGDKKLQDGDRVLLGEVELVYHTPTPDWWDSLPTGLTGDQAAEMAAATPTAGRATKVMPRKAKATDDIPTVPPDTGRRTKVMPREAEPTDDTPTAPPDQGRHTKVMPRQPKSAEASPAPPEEHRRTQVKPRRGE